MMKQKQGISVLLATALLLSALAGCKDEKKEIETNAESTAISVTAAQASLNTIETVITNTGEIKPAAEVLVTSKLSGKVTSVRVDVGSYVTAGQVLFTIDDTDYRLQANQARASYNSALASYNSTIGGTAKQSESQVQQALTAAKAELESAETAYNREKQLLENNSNVILAENAYHDAKAAYDRAEQLYQDDTTLIAARNAVNDAQNNHDRTLALLEAGAVSQVTADAAKNNLENAKAALETQETNRQASYDAAKSALVQAEQNLNTVRVNASAAYDAARIRLQNAKEGVKTAQNNFDLTLNVLNPERAASAQAGVKTAKAALDIAENTLKNTSVTAPISGYVSAKNVTAGQLAASGTSSVSIINTATVDVELNVTESVVSSIMQGAPARIHVTSAGIENVSGTVTSVSPSKNAQSGMFQVRLSIPNENGLLKSGMFADTEIIAKRRENVLCVPNGAVLTEENLSYVYLLDGTMAVKTEVLIGESNDELCEILSGIKEGDTVILKGKEYITDEKNTVKVVSE